MATPLTKPRLSSIAKKQIVAVTGLLMVGFILGHLAGNTLIFAGHESFNHYAEMLQSLGEFLWVVRFGLITALVCHVFCRQPRRFNSWAAAVNERVSAHISKIARTCSASALLTTSLLSTESYPRTGRPPVQCPRRRAASIL